MSLFREDEFSSWLPVQRELVTTDQWVEENLFEFTYNHIVFPLQIDFISSDFEATFFSMAISIKITHNFEQFPIKYTISFWSNFFYWFILTSDIDNLVF